MRGLVQVATFKECTKHLNKQEKHKVRYVLSIVKKLNDKLDCVDIEKRAYLCGGVPARLYFKSSLPVDIDFDIFVEENDALYQPHQDVLGPHWLVSKVLTKRDRYKTKRSIRYVASNNRNNVSIDIVYSGYKSIRGILDNFDLNPAKLVLTPDGLFTLKRNVDTLCLAFDEKKPPKKVKNVERYIKYNEFSKGAITNNFKDTAEFSMLARKYIHDKFMESARRTLKHVKSHQKSNYMITGYIRGMFGAVNRDADVDAPGERK